VIVDSAGDLLGVTENDGHNFITGGPGTVYEITYADGSYASSPTTLVYFNGSNGRPGRNLSRVRQPSDVPQCGRIRVDLSGQTADEVPICIASRRGFRGAGDPAAASGARRRAWLSIDHRPGFHLVVDGVVLPPKAAADGVYRFSLARPPGEVRLASRSAVPAETDATSCDRRRLGVSLRRIVLRDTGSAFDLPLDSPQLTDGWHPQEGNHRWTDGTACLPVSALALFRGKVEIEIALSPSQLRYAEPTGTALRSAGDIVSVQSARAA
jgi:hypothetical protein